MHLKAGKPQWIILVGYISAVPEHTLLKINFCETLAAKCWGRGRGIFCQRKSG
jgi:hypothetical protein